VLKAQKGDTEAFGILVERHRQQVYQVALAMVGHAETARDLTQDAFLRAYEAIARFRGDAKFTTWLRRIVTNVCLDHLRKGEHRMVVASYEEKLGSGDEDSEVGILTSHREAPDTGVSRKELGAAIVAALSALTPEQRTVLILREIEGLSYEEIAKTMDCATGTVMSRLFYGRRRLQALLREHHEG